MALAVALGCAETYPFVWYSAVPPNPKDAQRAERIQPGDEVRVVVKGHDELTGTQGIAEDGVLTLPLVGTIPVVGSKPEVAAAVVAQRLKPFFKNPIVSISITKLAPIQISAMGELGKLGPLTIPHDTSVLEALALSGGLSDFADRDSIYVIRKGPPARRIRFRYEDLVRPRADSTRFVLHHGDVLLVE